MNVSFSVAHHTKYLELLSKSTMLDEDPETFPSQVLLLQQDIEEFSNAIVLNLRRISANLKKVNLGDQITDLDERGLNLKSGNVEELKESELMELVETPIDIFQCMFVFKKN